jgi:hypothetical protein
VGWSTRVGGKQMVDLFFQSRVPFLCLEDGEGCFLRRLWFLTTTLAREVGKLRAACSDSRAARRPDELSASPGCERKSLEETGSMGKF